jgi:putative tricarboxylic transport membrane protein
MNDGGAAPMARDAVIGLVLIGLAVVVWLGAEGLPKSPLGGQIGADGFPKLLAGSLGVLALVLIGQTLLVGRRGGSRRAASVPPPSAQPASPSAVNGWRPHRRAAGMLAIGVVYLAVLSTLGFVFSTVLLLLAVALYSGRALSLQLLVIAAAGSAILYLLFVILLDVPLPPGFWPGLFGGR